MAMPERTGDWTVAMLDALPDDGQRYEIIDGVLYVTPAPRVRHQDVVTTLAAIFHPYVAACRARVLVAPTDVQKGERTSVQPDVLVVRFNDRGGITEPVGLPDLLLAIEVLSAGTARTDKREKRWLYQNEGVAEYWIVDADSWVIERWRPGDERPEILSERIMWLCEGVARPLTIELPAFFGALVAD